MAARNLGGQGMNIPQYKLTFTSGAALITESVIVAEIYNSLGNWPEVRAKVIQENSLQARTQSTLKKQLGEIIRRLKHLSEDQLKMLSTGEECDTKALIWLAICRQYAFISDFAKEVLVEQYETARYSLTTDDYESFFNSKADWHDNLDKSSKATKSKVRQVIFKMLRECNVINSNGEIVRQSLTPMLKRQIGIEDLQWFPGAHN